MSSIIFPLSELLSIEALYPCSTASISSTKPERLPIWSQLLRSTPDLWYKTCQNLYVFPNVSIPTLGTFMYGIQWPMGSIPLWAGPGGSDRPFHTERDGEVQRLGSGVALPTGYNGTLPFGWALKMSIFSTRSLFCSDKSAGNISIQCRDGQQCIDS